MSFNFNKIVNNKSFGFKRVNQSDCFFHAIYFLDNLTGSLLISKQYSQNRNNTSNGDLISGFLNALNLFIKEIKPGDTDEEIQEINFRETRILYERLGRLSVIAITKKLNLKFERHLLHYIINDFYNRYENSINQFNGIIEPSILNYEKKLEMLNYYNSNFEI
ncbi:MAG: hypothetical protein ACFFEO_03250 [Candidatus Thorarchaeota archaeon]